MKTVEVALIFSLSLYFAYSSSITLVDNESAIDDPAQSHEDPAVPSEDDEVVAFDTSNLVSEMWESRRCVASECNAHCRRLGHARGVCIGNFCQCRLRTLPLADFKEEAAVGNAVETVYKPLMQTDEGASELEEDESRASSRCSASYCAQLCRRLGFRYSRCSNGWCICWR